METRSHLFSEIFKKPDYLLCLDFDGVICDSSRECFVSSWAAYHRVRGGKPPSVVPADLYRRFVDLRPFIRSGRDYVLIQSLLDTGSRVRDQKEFDGHAARFGTATMDHYGDAFYRAREALLAEDRRFWISLNPLYEHMERGLKTRHHSSYLRIVSSKRPDFILRILAARGIPVPENRVYLADRIRKLDVVQNILVESDAARAFFVDDQIDHLRPNRYEKVIPALAAWGYIKREWLSDEEGLLVFDRGAMAQLFGGLPV